MSEELRLERTYEAAELVDEGWRSDDSGLPIFTAASAETIDSELIELRSREGATKLMKAAVLTEASDKRFYGDSSLEETCKKNQIDYGTGRKAVAAYKRLRELEIVERSTIVSALLSGELYWSKAEIAASVEDDEDYAELLNEAADGDLSASDMRKRVQELGGNVGGEAVFGETAVLDAAFELYRATGFPYRNLPIHICMEQINKLATTPRDELLSTNVGYAVADTYHPHRFDGHAIGMKSPVEAFDDDKLLKRALSLTMEHSGGVLGRSLIGKLSIVSGTQANSNFRPGFAAYMYRQYCQPGATVLDTSTGYGGRLVGFMSSGISGAFAGKYIGIDPSIKTHAGNSRMAEELGFAEAVELYNVPAEDMDAEAIANRCDFAFTSPPYFHKEVYSDEDTQSAHRYRSVAEWSEGFLAPMLALQYIALKDGAVAALNIANVTIKGETVPLIDMAIGAAQVEGFEFIGKGDFRLSKRFGAGHADEEVAEEAVLFFRKAAE